MSTYKNLKMAAAQLEALASKLEEADKAASLAKTAAETATKQAKLAADKAKELEAKQAELVKAAEAKTASAKLPEAGIADKAKLAAEALRKSAMISTQANQDQFAASVANSHTEALVQLAKLASFVRPPKMASVVVDNSTSSAPSADSQWESAVARVNSRLKL